MNSRTTWWLVGIALAMFAFIFFVESRGPGTAPARGRTPPLLADFDPNHVTTLEINGTNLPVRAERAGLTWRLASPVYPAQPGTIEQFLQKLAALRQLAVISPNEIASQTNGRAAFGLDSPRATVTIHSDTNRLTIQIGAKTLVGDQVYVQIDGHPAVHVTEGLLVSALPEHAYAWRDLRLIHVESKIDRLAVTNAGRGFQIQLDLTNLVWKLAHPLETRADLPRFGRLIQQLEHTRISRFVTDDPREDLDRFGLQNPESQIVLTFGTNEVLHVQFGKSPTNDPTQVFAKRRGTPTIFLVPKGELVPLVSQPFTYYRDHQFMSLASAPAITRVEGRAANEERFILERRGTNFWQIVSPFEALADSDLLRRFFEDLRALEIVGFEADLADTNNLAPYGLDAPARQYWLKSAAPNALGATNGLVAQLDFSAPRTNSMDRVLARRTDEPKSVYGVPYGDVARLPKAAFELRDRRLWRFDETNVVSITITQGGQTNRLTRDPVQGWSADEVLREARAETLHKLGRVRVVGWTGRGEEQLKRFPLNRKLEIATVSAGQSKNFVLQFGGFAASRDGFYATATLEENQPVLFVFPLEVFKYLTDYLGLAPEATAPP